MYQSSYSTSSTTSLAENLLPSSLLPDKPTHQPAAPAAPAAKIRKLRIALCMAKWLDLEAYSSLLEQRAEARVMLRQSTAKGLRSKIALAAVDVVLVDQKLLGKATLQTLEILLEKQILRGVVRLTEETTSSSPANTSGPAAPSSPAVLSPAVSSIVTVSRNSDPRQLFDFLQGVHYLQGTHRSPPLPLISAGKQPAGSSSKSSRGTDVTPREQQIWQKIAQGYSVRQIAEQLQLAESTVDSHKTRLMKKLDVHKSLDLVRLAVRFRLVDV